MWRNKYKPGCIYILALLYATKQNVYMKQLTAEQTVGLVSAVCGLLVMLVVIDSAMSNPYFTEDWAYHLVFGFGMVLTMLGLWVAKEK